MKSILLIEDDPFLIDIYVTKLEDEGFNVEVATDGEKCLKKLAEKKFDLLLLDLVLPRVDGWDVLKQIRNHPEEYGGQKLKIIVLSNLNQKEEFEKGEKWGVDKYLIKAHHTPAEVVKEIKETLK